MEKEIRKLVHDFIREAVHETAADIMAALDLEHCPITPQMMDKEVIRMCANFDHAQAQARAARKASEK